MTTPIVLQGSDEWRRLRLGKVTASRIADVIAQTRNGWGASRDDYMAELIAERRTGVPQDSHETEDMRRGRELEPQAREAYEFYCDVTVQPAAFVAHPHIAMSGASPDGYVGEDGLVEFKCPRTKTHIATLLGAPIPDRHQVQMQWQMACTGRAWCDYVSFDPRMPDHEAICVTRVLRDQRRIEQLEADVRQFLGELDAKMQRLDTLFLELAGRCP